MLYYFLKPLFLIFDVNVDTVNKDSRMHLEVRKKNKEEVEKELCKTGDRSIKIYNDKIRLPRKFSH